MSRHSEIRTEDLKRIRHYLFFRYSETDCKTNLHAQIGAELDLIGLELNLRTGETKYKL
jgi:hypothetical protein